MILFYSVLIFCLVGFSFSSDIVVYDGNYLFAMTSNSESHEHMQLLAALGGIVNRNSPRLFVNATSADSLWLNYLRMPNAWLEKSTLSFESSIVGLVSKYSTEIKGVVLYDGSIPSTSNVASTLSGIHDLLPILAGGSLYSLLCLSGPQLPVSISLVNKFDGSLTGNVKTDAYEWFRTNYMQKKSNSSFNPAIQGYFMVLRSF